MPLSVLLGVFITAAFVRPFSSMFGYRILDRMVLGIHASGLSSDLTHVTLRIRNPAILEEVVRATEGRSVGVGLDP